MKTINCRDDSLIEDRGMWTTMKKKKRCIIVAQGFYEWLKKNGGKEKLPHFTKRKDGQLMCFAGLWDCVQFEGMSCQNDPCDWQIRTTVPSRCIRAPNASLQHLHVAEPTFPGSEPVSHVSPVCVPLCMC
jgi:putative SOS response-associated peptidase YedK